MTRLIKQKRIYSRDSTIGYPTLVSVCILFGCHMVLWYLFHNTTVFLSTGTNTFDILNDIAR